MIQQAPFGVYKASATTRTSFAGSALTSATCVLLSNPARNKFFLQNAGATISFYIGFTATGGTPTVSSSSYTFKLNPGDFYEDTSWVGEVHAIASASSSDVLIVTEMA